jgi:hypothetical protein
VGLTFKGHRNSSFDQIGIVAAARACPLSVSQKNDGDNRRALCVPVAARMD